MTDLSDTYLGQYHLIEPIGHGGMSTVYKAYQASLDRYVAVKVLTASHDPQFASRFRREARAVAALQHPNILPIYDYGEEGALAYFVMQYVENGVTLQDRLGTPMPPTEAVPLIGQVLSALEYAHRRGIVHRDIKPANVLLPAPSWAMLADFGIAKLVNDSQHLTLTGFIVGTAAYMAPEQAAGRPVDARTDLYSIGVVLYELLAGQPPFYADTPMALLTQHVYDPPPPPRTINPQIHPAVEEALLQALAKHPDDRYQSAGEMRADLERVVSLLGKPYVSPKVTDLYLAGVQAFHEQRWDEAVDRLNRALRLDPEHDDAANMLEMARAQRNAGRRSAARPQANTGPRPALAPIGQTTEKVVPSAPKPRIRCQECGRIVQSDWQVCPYCRAAIAPLADARPDASSQGAPAAPVAMPPKLPTPAPAATPVTRPLAEAAAPAPRAPAVAPALRPLAETAAPPSRRAIWPLLLVALALIGVSFVLAASAGVLLLASNPHAGEHGLMGDEDER
ncbi:MAG TPA: protein kinase, partial [Kouleothrix sp.]|nr:protein kinase [Kouleothrix sp.]